MGKSNMQLQQDVLQELDYEPRVDAAEIGVTAKDGIVSLAGSVKSFAEKDAALHTAQRVAGVAAVADELRVELPSMHMRNDEDVARAVVRALQWDVFVPSDGIRVKVTNGWITLEGEVTAAFQRSAAEDAIRNLMGVRGVSNQISLRKVAIQPCEVKMKIERALQRAAEEESKRIQVSVEGDRVILRGNVSSWAEREQARSAAWAAEGVNSVEDDLVIV